MSISTGKVNAQTTEDDQTMGQQPSVDQLDDVKSTDWAYEALKNLDKRYNCLTSSPGKSNLFEGDRAITRYEFADGLNLCLAQIDKLIGNVSKDFIKKDDLETLGRLKSNFSTEITEIRTRVGKLEEKTGKLEKNQFSDKVKLDGELIIGLNTLIGDKKAVPGTQNPTDKLNDNTTFSNRLRLNLNAKNLLCDTEKEDNNCTDQLKVRLQSANTTPFDRGITGTVMPRVGFDADTQNNLQLHRLEYKYQEIDPQTKFNHLTFIVAANGEGLDDMLKTYSKLFESAATGSISRFGRFAPIFRQSDGGAGLAVTYDISKDVGVTIGYLATPKQANDPSPGKGLFNGGYSLFVQVDLWKSKGECKQKDDKKQKCKWEWEDNDFNIGFTYINSYEHSITQDVRISGNTGSIFGEQPFGNIPTSSHHFGLEASYKMSPKSFLDFWGHYTRAEAEITSGSATKGNQAEIFTWGVRYGFGDKDNNLLGFILGMQPKVISNDIKDRVDHDLSWHFETFYRWRLDTNGKDSKNKFYFTPGFIYIMNPEHNSNNSDIFVGTMRFTFQF